MSNGIRKIVFSAFLFGMAFVSFKFMIQPTNQALGQTKERVQTQSVRLREFEQAAVAAKSFDKQLEKLQEAIDFFESKLPSTSETHRVLEQVTLIAQRQGLQPKTISTMDMRNNSGYIEQPMKMTLEGNFNSFYSFMLELEKLPRIIKVRELDLNKTGDSEGWVQASFVISIFFQNGN